MTNTTTITAEQSPELMNKLAQQAMSEQEATVLATKPEVQLPPSPEVELPGGLLDPILGTISTAEVRELNGADEEAIAKVNNVGKSLLLILERATTKIGEEPASKDLLDALYAGDREMLMLAIRKITFGTDVKVGPGQCPSCGTEQVFDIDLDKDVPIKKLEGDRQFTVKCNVGEVSVVFPTGSTQKEMVASNDKTSAELDTILLKNCVKAINGVPVLNTETVRSLGLKDRRTLLNEITSRNPGPQLGAIKKDCQSCGQEVPLPLTLAELF